MNVNNECKLEWQRKSWHHYETYKQGSITHIFKDCFIIMNLTCDFC